MSPQALRSALIAETLEGDEGEVTLQVAMPWMALTTAHGAVAIPIREGRYPWRQIAAFIQSSQHDIALPWRWRGATAAPTPPSASASSDQSSAPPSAEDAATPMAAADGVDRLLQLCRQLSERGIPPVLTIDAAGRQVRWALTWYGHDSYPGSDNPTCHAVLAQDLPEALPAEFARSVRVNGMFLARARRVFGAIEPRMLIPATQRDRPVRLDGYDAILGVWLLWLIMPMLTPHPSPSSPSAA